MLGDEHITMPITVGFSRRARRTASARNSGGYGEWLLGIGDSHLALNAPTVRVSTEPGQLQAVSSPNAHMLG